MKTQSTKKRMRRGRIRINDDSLKHAGINKGDVCVIRLDRLPKQDELCAAFTAERKLVICHLRREPNGDIRLSAGTKLIQVFAPDAVITFGPVVRVEKGGK